MRLTGVRAFADGGSLSGLRVPSPADKPVKAPNPKETVVMGLITQMPTWACTRPEATASASAVWSRSAWPA